MPNRLVFAPGKLARRRATTLDQLASGDSLVQAASAFAVRVMTGANGPDGPAVICDDRLIRIADYYKLKRQAVRAHYFRQRYGRDYWTGEPRRRRAAIRAAGSAGE